MRGIAVVIGCLLPTAVVGGRADEPDAPAPEKVLAVVAKINRFGGEYFQPGERYRWSSAAQPEVAGRPAHGFSFTGAPAAEGLEQLAASGAAFPYALNLYTPRKEDNAALLKHLGALKGVRSLRLHGGMASDGVVPQLSRIEGLRALELGCAPWLTGEGLEQLAALKQLQALRLYQCFNVKFTDARLRQLARLKDLGVLEILYNSRVTDAGLEELAKLKKLRVLYLHGAQVTDDGLQCLAACRELRELHLPGARDVTEAGVAALLRALPGLQVRR